MHPILFEIPGLGFPIRSFGVMVAAGMFLAIWIWGKLLERHGDDPVEDPIRSSQVAIWVVIGILLGARALYVVVESSRYLGADLTEEMETYLDADNRAQAELQLSQQDPQAVERARAVMVGHDFLADPVKMLLIWEGGLVMYGGLLGSILLGLWSSRKHGLDPWNAFDTCLVAGFFGLAVGRWGCLLVGDDFGSVVPENWAHLPFPLTVTVPEGEFFRENPESLFPRDLAGQKLWATQVWMSVNATIIGLLGILALKKRSWRGQAGAFVIVYYSITRYIIESFRGDEIRGVWFGGALSTSQLISIVGLLLGIALLVKKPGPAPPKPPASPDAQGAAA